MFLYRNHALEILKRLASAGSANFEKDGMWNDVGPFFQVVLSYCCNKWREKYILCVKHGTAVTIPRVICMITMNNIRKLKEFD